MDLRAFNQLGKEKAAALLAECCGSAKWQQQMLEAYPFASVQSLVQKADAAWYKACNESDWLEAFTHHPRIGDAASLAAKFPATAHFAGKEQQSVAQASTDTIEALLKANDAYDEKFGFIFIICATGKSAEEMLELINRRVINSKEEELLIAMGEQQKISILRLKKVLDAEDWALLKPSQLTTHVLDTSVGKPGKGLYISLKRQDSTGWQTFSGGITNADGRVADLLPPEHCLPPGNYLLSFDTAQYFLHNQTKGFYPQVDIQFSITDESHYHVPLLINPFGYSTYRGS